MVLAQGSDEGNALNDNDRPCAGHGTLEVDADPLGVYAEQTGESPGVVGGVEHMGCESSGTQRHRLYHTAWTTRARRRAAETVAEVGRLPVVVLREPPG